MTAPNTAPTEALPPLPEPWTAASTLRCTACGAPYEPARALAPMSAESLFGAVSSGACKCGNRQFGGTFGYDSPSPAKYTAEQMRAFYSQGFEAGRATSRAGDATRDVFAELRALTEALLTRADADYLSRCVDAAVKAMAERGCLPPVPWPDEDFGIAVWGCAGDAAPEGAAEILKGWVFNEARAAEDDDSGDGVWEIGHLNEDGLFSAVIAVDTGNYFQPEHAEPIARAILGFLAAPQPARVDASQPLTWPPLDDTLRDILGRICFQCIPFAQALRAAGRVIASKAEDEQAATIHWMLGHYFTHGDDWKVAARADMERMAAKAGAPLAAAGEQQ